MRFRLTTTLAFLSLSFCLANKLAATAKQTSSARPNILLIVVDDLRWDALSCTGHPFSQTPNIDRIAKEGIIFQNAFTTHSLCSPSRATLLTGLYSHQHRVRDNNTPLDAKFPMVPQILQKSGYETAFIGKWHMGHSEARPKPGFNHWVSFIGQGQYTNPAINVNDKWYSTTGHLSDILTDYALEYLSRDRSAPFFLMLSHKAVHQPFTTQPRFKGIYANANIIFPPTWEEDLSDKPAFLQDYLAYFKFDLKLLTRQYYECLAGIDDGVKKILDKLTEKKALDNTLIIFMSDNGYFFGEHNLGDKRLAYEESMRIPLFMRYPPSFSAGTKSAKMALTVDLAPTLLNAAAIPDSFNLPGVPLQKLAASKAERASFLYQYFVDPALPIVPAMRAIRTRDYKYILYGDSTATQELYNLKKDSIEASNLIKEPAYSPVVKRLRFQLDSLRFAVNDTSLISSVDERSLEIPVQFVLHQNYPNPFNPTTTIKYSLPSAAHVQLKIFDVNGQEVATLIDAIQNAGVRSVQWDASGYANGLYFCRLAAGAFAQTQKLTVIK